MSRNIYDIFNERKSGIDCLVEGYEADIESMEFENDDEIAYTMEAMIQENANELIEFQAASYLEDLVIENLMYNRFDEESSMDLIEEAMGDRIAGIKERLNKAWKAIKAWFAGVIENVGKMFHANEAWVKENADKIREGLDKTSLKVKMNHYVHPNDGTKAIRQITDNIRGKASNAAINKNAILAAAGVKDRSQLPEIAKKCFIKGEAVAMNINSLDPDVVIAYAGGKKHYMDYLNNEQKKADYDYSDMIKKLDDSEKSAKLYENFTLARGLVDTLLSNCLTIMKKATSDMLKVCRKAVSLANKAVNAGKYVKGKAGDIKDDVKQGYQNAKANAKQGYQNAKANVQAKFNRANESYEYDDYYDEYVEESYYDEEYDYIEEGMFSKYRKLSDEELDNKIEELQAALADIEAGDGPKKFLKKAQNELKDARNEKARRGKKADRAANKAAKKEERAANKAAKKEARAAKKAAKKGGGEAIPAAESFMADLDEVEFEDDYGFYDEY